MITLGLWVVDSTAGQERTVCGVEGKEGENACWDRGAPLDHRRPWRRGPLVKILPGTVLIAQSEVIWVRQ